MDARVLGALIVVVSAQALMAMVTTTREPFEKENLGFTYDPLNHIFGMIVSGNHNHECYIISLNQQEQVLVHSSAGIQTLEQRLVGLMTSDSKEMISMDQLNATSPRLTHKCHHATEIYRLKQVL